MSKTPRKKPPSKNISVSDLKSLSLAEDSHLKSNICLYFQKGKCTHGDTCKWRHEIIVPSDNNSLNVLCPAPKKREICRQFRDRGNCKHGDQCKFSHDLITQATEGESYLSSNDMDSTYRAWKRLLGHRQITSNRSFPPLNTTEMQNFLDDALKVLDSSDPENKQNLVRDLGGEAGLNRFKQIVDSGFSRGYSVRQLSFEKHCVPFLKLVSHKELRNSLVLEKAVGSIYTFIYGPDGKRGIAFFQSVSENLYGMVNEASTPGVGEALCAAACTLYHMISLNPSATVQIEFKDVLSILCACYVPERMSDYEARTAQMELEKITERLNMGDSIRLAGSRTKTNPHPQPKIIHGIDYPGELSPKGRRHDNDHAKIEDIKILPTHGEIKTTDRTEYLPTADPSDPHHENGVFRLLDTHFRLLREDTSGLLRDAIQGLHSRWETLVEKQGKRQRDRDQNMLKTFIYHDLVAEGIRFSKFKGLEIDISFTQPKRVAQMRDKQDRKFWWENAKHNLQNGSLLALVSRNDETIFLIVSERVVTRGSSKGNSKGNLPFDLSCHQARAPPLVYLKSYDIRCL